jgi:uncharacterized protein (TIGR02328 family)
MRLWHKNLIKVLPREQLVAQWRELSAIAGAIQKNGTPNHILVNFVLNYSWNDFISYAYYVREEMTKRGYRTMNSVWDKITGVAADYIILPFEEVYVEKMDNIYFKICFYNLYEKILCGGIQEPDSSRIISLYEEKI